MHLLVDDSRRQNIAQRGNQVHNRTNPIARGKRMDDDRHGGNSSAGTRAIRKSTHHRRHQRRVIRQKRRRGKDGQLHVHKQAPKAHINAMVTSCLVLHLFVFSKWICCDCSDIRSPASFIRTLTVGTGISPVQPACEPTHTRVADSSARSQTPRLRHGIPLTPPDLPPVGNFTPP